MTEDDISRIVDKAVHSTLLSLGIEMSDPNEMQRDFMFVRNLRRSAETVKKQGLITAVGILMAAFLGWIFLQVKDAL